MAWVKLDENIADHPKVLTAGPVAFALHIAMLCHANRFLTDGFISTHTVKSNRNVVAPLKWAERLVASGLWEVADGGYRIHDYHDYQPKAADVREKRIDVSAARSEAGKVGAAKRWQNDGKRQWQLPSKQNGKPMAPSRPVTEIQRTLGPAQNAEPLIEDSEAEKLRKDKNREAVGWVNNRWCVLYAKYRHGAKYMPTYDKEVPLVRRLLSVHEAPHLDKLAAIFLNTKDGWVENTECSIGIFSIKINLAESKLREYEAKNGPITLSA